MVREKDVDVMTTQSRTTGQFTYDTAEARVDEASRSPMFAKPSDAVLQARQRDAEQLLRSLER